MERKLASVQLINNLLPIDGADMIEVAVVNGWKVVVKKGEFNVGDTVIYCEIDSLLPIKEDFEFLRKSSYKKLKDGTEGFRLKTIKLRGQLSQGLVLPISVLGNTVVEIGCNVSDILGIKKYDPPIPAELSGIIKSSFPNFIQKTDEERIQNLANVYDNFKKQIFYVTEKLDGSSATFYINNGVFGVCSRNVELVESDTNSFWAISKKLDIKNKLESLNKNICLQGELIGFGIQGNPYKMNTQSIRFFNAFNIDEQEFLSFTEFKNIINFLGLETVPIIDECFTIPENIDSIIEYADGVSVLNNKTNREGVVIRNHKRTISFKVISNKYLLKSEN
jgi:RNA ligase (TIGR02306 family)